MAQDNNDYVKKQTEKLEVAKLVNDLLEKKDIDW